MEQKKPNRRNPQNKDSLLIEIIKQNYIIEINYYGIEFETSNSGQNTVKQRN